MILPAKAGTKHIILFADAADSEEPGDYKTLVAKCVKAGITISVVGLGTEKDCDAELLKDIARRGGGQCMFTNVAQELPRLFAQDTFVIARSAFLDEPVAGSSHRRADCRSRGSRWASFRRSADTTCATFGRTRTWRVVSRGRVQGARAQLRGRPAWEGCCATRARPTGNTPARSPAGRTRATSSRRLPAGRRESPRGLARTSWPRRNSATASAASSCTSIRHARRRRFTRLPELTTLSARPGETAATKKTRDELVVGRHAVGGNPAGRQRDDPGDRGGARHGASHAGPDVPALLAGVSAAEAGAGNRGVGATGQVHRRLRAAEPGRRLERHPQKAAVDFADAVSAAGGRGGILAGGGAAAHGASVSSAGSRWACFDARWPRERRAEPSSSSRARPRRKEIAVPAAKELPPAAKEPSPAQGETGNESMADALNRAQQRARKRTERG